MDKGRLIQGMDIIEYITNLLQKNRKYQAIMLQEIENILGRDSEEFSQVRKIILDKSNDYTRSILKSIFGTDFEGYIK
jgi:hypothetical protein